MSARVGIDTGGTFTDFVRVSADGVRVHKIRTTSDDPVVAVVEGLDHLMGAVGAAALVYGSTVATNAVLERKGARVALVTTAGFEDVLAIGRQTRPALYDIDVPAPRSLVSRDLVFGIGGRLDADGRELQALDMAEVDRVAGLIAASGAEAVALCFLHAYANGSHEALVARRLRRAGLQVSASHEVLPEYREYERWSTTAVNAYVQPLVSRYLGRLEQAIGGRSLSVMQSNGGSISAAKARAAAVRTVLSGPAAGVVGARAVAAAARLGRVISFDAGGTSTDVSLIDGEVPMANEAAIGDVPVRLPVIDIHTVGAGGGSIARVDRGGGLVVGPESAGAFPGPACYGVGSELTVTDAHLLLGRLRSDDFLGGRMPLDEGRARRVAAQMARRLRLSVEELAEGVIHVANARMQRAIRVVSLERGHDPRRFALVAFGGAGGMHAADLAAGLGIGVVLVPRLAGVLSAFGMLVADVRRDYSAAVLRPAAAVTRAELERIAKPLVARARRDLAAEGFRGSHQVVLRELDVRYVGQSHELTVSWSTAYTAAFHALHHRRYGYSDPARPVEVVALRVQAVGVTSKPALPSARRSRPSAPRPAAVHAGRFGGRSHPTAFYRWDDLAPGHHAGGPAVITGGEATVVVPPAFQFLVDRAGNIRLGMGR